MNPTFWMAWGILPTEHQFRILNLRPQHPMPPSVAESQPERPELHSVAQTAQDPDIPGP